MMAVCNRFAPGRLTELFGPGEIPFQLGEVGRFHHRAPHRRDYVAVFLDNFRLYTPLPIESYRSEASFRAIDLGEKSTKIDHKATAKRNFLVAAGKHQGTIKQSTNALNQLSSLNG